MTCKVQCKLMVELTSPFKTSFSRDELVMVRRKAFRKGVWFKALSRIERLQIDLTVRLVEKVKSFLLAKVLRSILKKLFEAMESRVSRLMREVGVPLARKLSAVAKSWGHSHAERWVDDLSFVKFLAVTYMNTPGIYRINIVGDKDN